MGQNDVDIEFRYWKIIILKNNKNNACGIFGILI